MRAARIRKPSMNSNAMYWWCCISAVLGIAGLAVWWTWPCLPLLVFVMVDWIVTVVFSLRAVRRGEAVPGVALLWLVFGGLSGLAMAYFVLGWIAS
jgi:hypothetical protein